METDIFRKKGASPKFLSTSFFTQEPRWPNMQSNVPEDSIVGEKIKQLPQEKYEFTGCLQDRKMAPEEAAQFLIVKLVFLRKPDTEHPKGIISYRAIALTSVMSKWFRPV